MHITVIGTGNVGRTLGTGWAAQGHTVTFGSRQPERDDVRALTRQTGTQATTPAEAAQTAEMIVLATPWKATEAAIQSLGNLTSKILIDATNPIGPGLSLVGDPSGGEQVARWAEGAHVVKAFNTTGWDNMADTDYDNPVRPVMFYCGDDADAKTTVASLIEDLGFEAVDAGPLSRALQLEHLAILWISQAFMMGAGRDMAFAVLRR